MENKIKALLLGAATEIFGQEISENLVQFQKTRKEFEGDITLVTFPFVKMLKTKPEEVGEKVGAYLVEHVEELEAYNVVKGFLNLVINKEFWLAELKNMDADARFGFRPENSGDTLMVEYSSPNTNKPLHLGHLRNNFLGYSVAEILKANGHKVIKTQIVNDRGIHICKSMLAWQKFAPEDANGQKETPQTTGVKGDHFVGKYYVEFENQLIKEACALAEEKLAEGGFDAEEAENVEKLIALISETDAVADKSKYNSLRSKLAGFTKNETSLLQEAQEMLVKWEAKDPQTYLLWSTMNGWVYEGFASTYERMGVDFDKMYYESDTFLIGKDLVLEGLEKGLFFKKEDGSVWVDLTDEGLDEKLLLRADGTAVYMTQDLGTAFDRFRDYPDLNGIVYTVGNEQDYHFKVLFLVLKKLGYSWADSCFHLSYGMVDLPDGKMKSREGKVVDADDLMAEVVHDAMESTKERGHLDGLSEEERNDLYEMIGLGGLKYFLLKVDPQKRMKFDPKESIDLNGNTAPFIQYAHARIQSLLSKAGELKAFNTTAYGAQEKELIKLLASFPETVAEAGKNHSPALIANYTFELVKLYNTFYQSVYILNEPNEELKQLRLALSANVAKVIKQAMLLLGIKVPNRM
ncbi:arginyl-tRNA synthetase [Lishizhenia tianjinensis]|uniref:Arginine--tRNA ligase n=1 Tax=Lishizhenia tianjinensis TaxID=477690 RepID=A0A1I6YMM0_9FLAO|nr:arginine--tRNA ligase [Lishizhenia tianjinensis]SFT51692.1 arginyl-tRNA synthetase [Lishizhenia tianjinensis]